MIWTQEQRDELIRLWDNGKRSYAEIGRIMGLNKNQIVGRMHREKRIRNLPIEDKFSHRKSGQPCKPKEKKVLTLPVRAELAISRIVVPTIPRLDEGQIASIVDVTGCRWAVSFSDTAPGGHMFCNHATDEGQSYCPYHKAESVASYSRSLVSKTVRSAWHVYNRRVAA